MDKTILIIGGGFGGVYTAKEALKGKFKVVLIADEEFVFTPLLHQVATGIHDVETVRVPIQDILGKRAEIVKGRAILIDNEKKIVKADLIGTNKEIIGKKDYGYNTLVVATGAKTNFYGIEGASEFALPLKTVEDALKIKEKLEKNFEDLKKNPEKSNKTIVVCGAGPTGVEIAAEIKEMADKRKVPVRVILVQKSETILPTSDSYIQHKAMMRLRDIGIEIMTGMEVKKVTEKGVYMQNRFVPTKTVIWSSGVTPQAPGAFKGIDTDTTLESREDGVFALGDCAVIPQYNKKDAKNGRVPALAQAAVQEAKIAGKNAVSYLEGEEMKEFRFRQKGFMLSMGKWNAIVEIGKIRFSGVTGGIMWKITYAMMIPGIKRKIKVLID